MAARRNDVVAAGNEMVAARNEWSQGQRNGRVYTNPDRTAKNFRRAVRKR